MIASSADGGTTWMTKHFDANGAALLAMGFADEKFGYAAGAGGVLLFTDDGGETWIAQSVDTSVIYAAAFSDRRHGLIHTRSAVLSTVDGGKSWNPVPVPPKEDNRSPGFGWVFSLGVVDSRRMAVIFKEGAAQYFSQRLVVTGDGGNTWSTQDIPSMTLHSFTVHGGEFWVTGTEVIEKDKPGGGYAVPVAMHSADGQTWTHAERPKEVPYACTVQGCLYRNGEAVKLFEKPPERYWVSSAEKALTTRWAVAGRSICSVGVELRCSAVEETTQLPQKEERAQVPATITPPALGPETNRGPQCILCPFETVIVTKDYQGVAEVELKLQIDTTGLVSEVQVVHATKPDIGDRMMVAARNWIFAPYKKDGTPHPAVTSVKLRIQAIKSR